MEGSSSYSHYSAAGANCAFHNEVSHFLLSRLSYSNESYDYYAHLETIFQSPEFLEKFIYLSRGEWVFIYIFGILFAVAIGGNFLVCFAVLRNEHMQTVTNYYIVNLSISDILMIILCMPPTVMHDFLDTWYFGPLGCKMLPYFQWVSASVSIFTLAAIAADRYLAICRPLKFHIRSSRTLSVIALIWTVSFIIPCPLIIYYEYEGRSFAKYLPHPAMLSTCAESKWFGAALQKIYHSCLILIVYVIPLCIIAVAYAMVCARLWSAIPTEEAHSHPSTFRSPKLLSSERKGSSKSHQSTKSSTENQKESRRKVARMLIVLVFIFAVCYFPMHAMTVYRFLFNQDDLVCDVTHYNLTKFFTVLSHFLVYLNSSANPIIYNFLSAKFRREFKAALCPFLQTKQRQLSYSRATLNSRARRTTSRESRPSSNTGVISTEYLRMSNMPKFPEA